MCIFILKMEEDEGEVETNQNRYSYITTIVEVYTRVIFA